MRFDIYDFEHAQMVIPTIRLMNATNNEFFNVVHLFHQLQDQSAYRVWFFHPESIPAQVRSDYSSSVDVNTYMDMDTKQEYPYFSNHPDFEPVYFVDAGVMYKCATQQCADIQGLYVEKSVFIDLLNVLLDLDACRILNARASSALSTFKDHYYDLIAPWIDQMMDMEEEEANLEADTDLLSQVKQLSKRESKQTAINEQRNEYLNSIDFDDKTEARKLMRAYYHTFRVVDLTPVLSSLLSDSRKTKKLTKKSDIVRFLVDTSIKQRVVEMIFPSESSK